MSSSSSSSGGAGAGAGASSSDADARGVKRAREGEGGSGESGGAAAPQLPAPRSHTAAGVAEDVAGAIGPLVTSWLPTATLTLEWMDSKDNQQRGWHSVLPVPDAVVEALCARAVRAVGPEAQWYNRSFTRKFTVTKKAGSVFVMTRTYSILLGRKQSLLPNARAAATTAVAADETLSLTFGEVKNTHGDYAIQQFTISEHPQHTASETRVHAALDALLAVLHGGGECTPILTVRTDDLAVKIASSDFPAPSVPFSNPEIEDDDEDPPRFHEGRFDFPNPNLDDDKKRALLEFMLASAERQRAAARAKIAQAVALFFAAET